MSDLGTRPAGGASLPRLTRSIGRRVAAWAVFACFSTSAGWHSRQEPSPTNRASAKLGGAVFTGAGVGGFLPEHPAANSRPARGTVRSATRIVRELGGVVRMILYLIGRLQREMTAHSERIDGLRRYRQR